MIDREPVGPGRDCSPLVPIYVACCLFGLALFIAILTEKLQ